MHLSFVGNCSIVSEQGSFWLWSQGLSARRQCTSTQLYLYTPAAAPPNGWDAHFSLKSSCAPPHLCSQTTLGSDAMHSTYMPASRYLGLFPLCLFSFWLVHLFSSPLCCMLSCSFQIMTSVLQIPNAVFTVVKCTHLTALHHLCVMQSFIFSLFPELASSSPSSPLHSLPSLYSIFLWAVLQGSSPQIKTCLSSVFFFLFVLLFCFFGQPCSLIERWWPWLLWGSRSSCYCKRQILLSTF